MGKRDDARLSYSIGGAIIGGVTGYLLGGAENALVLATVGAGAGYVTAVHLDLSGYEGAAADAKARMHKDTLDLLSFQQASISTLADEVMKAVETKSLTREDIDFTTQTLNASAAQRKQYEELAARARSYLPVASPAEREMINEFLRLYDDSKKQLNLKEYGLVRMIETSR